MHAALLFDGVHPNVRIVVVLGFVLGLLEETRGGGFLPAEKDAVLRVLEFEEEGGVRVALVTGEVALLAIGLSCLRVDCGGA